MVTEKGQTTVPPTLLTHLSCMSWQITLSGFYLPYVLAYKLLNSGINWTQIFSWDKTFRRTQSVLTLPPLKPMTNSPGPSEARLLILYFDSSDIFIFRTARENNPRIFNESQFSKWGWLPRVLHLLQVSFFYRIAGINTVFSEIPTAGKMDVYNYIVAFLTQQSELTGNPSVQLILCEPCHSLQVVRQS